MNIDELAQFLFVNQFSKCSHCAYYGDICNGEFFDEKSCTEGIKRFLSSDDDVDLRMQEFRAKVASGEHANNAYWGEIRFEKLVSEQEKPSKQKQSFR